MSKEIECLDSHYDDECAGEVEFRVAMSPTGKSFPRCAKHFDARWKVQEQISDRYSVPMTYYGDESDSFSWQDEAGDY